MTRHRTPPAATLTVLVLVAALLAAAGSAAAHLRLRTGSGAGLFHPNPAAVPVVISSIGSDDIVDGSHATAVRNAIAAWNDLTGTGVHLVENTTPSQQSRTDWPSDNLRIVLWDENNSSGFFGGSTVAITPVEFFSSGLIVDADVIFNGQGFNFTTEGQVSRFDVQDVAAHELGHFLGLDHTSWAGATMYPFVSTAVIAQRSLSADDGNGMREAYPSGTQARFTGRVLRASDMSPVEGAAVHAVDSLGRSGAAAFSDDTGAFTLIGLAPETYTLWAHPLDGPVNIQNVDLPAVETDFEATPGPATAILAGQTVAYGDILVGANVAIDLGSSADPLPLRGVADGVGRPRALFGTQLSAGSTLTASDPAVVVSAATFMNNSVAFTLTVPPATPPGHVDLIVTNLAGDTDLLPAAIEITPPDPTVTNVVPASGTAAGGTPLTISGTGFRAGARVVIGPNVYVDGAGATVASANTITLTTAATPNGLYDVVVIDETGVEGRDANAFQAVVNPTLSSVFPAAGASAGGTEIRLRGADFLPGLVVRIDGVVQSSVVVTDPMNATVTTDPGLPGGPYVLQITNPGGGMASSAFSYVAQADPVIAMVQPVTGSAAGGDTITLDGSGFGANTSVVFGADPLTGQGGTPAAAVMLLGPGTLEATTPALAAGAVSVMVIDSMTGQADVVAAAFTFQGGGGGGGGSCTVAPLPPQPFEPRDALGAWWLAAAAGALAWRARRARTVRA